jgi:lysozyme
VIDLDKLKDSLRRHEATRRFPYRDTTGNLTVGVGHNLTGKGLSDAAIAFVLNEDILDAKTLLATWAPWALDLDDVRQRVFIELAFNMGAKLLGFAKALNHAKAGRWDAAADAFLDSLWAKQVGKRAVTLADMLRSGKDPADA